MTDLDIETDARPPIPPVTDPDGRAVALGSCISDAGTDLVTSWGGQPVLRLDHHTVLHRVDVTTCDVVRSCTRCHTQWPEK